MIDLLNLSIDRDGTDPDAHVSLTQDIGGNEHTVYLHPCQVRLLAERMGLLVPDVEAQRTIARLSRQMRTLLDRINHLDDWLHTQSDTAYADLSYEQTYSMATWELAREFVADLPDAGPKLALPKTTERAPASTIATAAGSDRTNAARQKRHRDRQKQQRNGAAVTGVTDADRNATPAPLFT